MPERPEVRENRVLHAYNIFVHTGQVMFNDSKAMYQNLCKVISGKKVADVGCSIGLGTAMLERKNPGVVGFDVVPGNVFWSARVYPWCEFRVWNVGSDVPYPEVFDEVVCLEVLEHVNAGQQVIDNLLAMTKERLWLSTPNRACPLEQGPIEKPSHVKLYTPDEVLAMLHGRGKVILRDWEDFIELRPEQLTHVTPILYEVIL